MNRLTEGSQLWQEEMENARLNERDQETWQQVNEEWGN